MDIVSEQTEYNDIIRNMISHDGTLKSYAEYFHNTNHDTLAFDEFPCIRKGDETCQK